MSDSNIWLVGSDGSLTELNTSTPSDEDHLQTLIAVHRDLIAEESGDLLLVRREQPIGDSDESSGRWSLDHLFVTREAVPVLVEVKRASDTRLRREVVGQMLDYAANGTSYWNAGAAGQSFAYTCAKADLDPDETLSDFLGPNVDGTHFWDQVDENFRNGRLKLLFVADHIPDELATIIEFLNDHTRDHLQIRAIELRYLEGANGLLALVKRTIGETAQSKARKTGSRRLEPIGIDEWIEREIAPKGSATLNGVKKWLEILHRLGASTTVASTQGSIVSFIKDYEGRKRYPLHMDRPGRGTISFAWVHECPGVASEKTRQAFLERFSEAVGPLSTTNLRGYPSFPAERLNDPVKAEAFEQVAKDWLEAVGRPEDI